MNPKPVASPVTLSGEMCKCGHVSEAHFDFGCGCETERDVTCECKAFVAVTLSEGQDTQEKKS